ncbi:hypothetical protein HDU97_007107 [Phlyctochytrium planicorne]|nr:hypothetical protein HDU97_007107 [Phlyctochytrium planicorne]
MSRLITCSAVIMASSVVVASAGSSSCPLSNPGVISWWDSTFGNSLNLQVISNKYIPATNEVLIGTFGALYSYKDGKSTKVKGDGDNYWGSIRTDSSYLVNTPNALFRSSGLDVSKPNFQAVPNVMAPGGYPLSSTASDMFARSGNQIIWGTQNGFYISENDGLNWTPLDCQPLLALANTPNQTINECQYLFVRGMTVNPSNTQILSVFTALGLSGVYSLDLPIAKENGVFKPKFGVVHYNPICKILPQDANEGTLCPQSGPLAVFNGKVYVGAGDRILSIPYPPAQADGKVNGTEVLVAPNSAETELVGLATSLDSKVIVASWGGSLHSSPVGDLSTWTQVDISKCSIKGYFTRSLAPSTNSPPAGTASFMVGTSKGPLVWSIKTA